MKNSILVVSLVVLLCFGLSYKVQAKQEMTEQDVKVLVDKGMKIYNTGDMALIPELYAPEVVLHVSGNPEDIIGHEGIKKWVEFVRTSYPDFTLTPDETIVKGDKAVTIWTMAGTNTGSRGALPPTGKKFRVKAISFSHMKNGKVVKEITVYDMLELMTQLGYTV
ncbi:MAG: ester cyclase, partial [Candidatus Aminicenantales bacterium]